MKEFIKELIGRFEKESHIKYDQLDDGYCFDAEHFIYTSDAIRIVNELAEEQKHDMVTQLAMMYAKNIYVYGVDVTKAWESAVQNHMALEKAYIRGRQDESDKFSEWREEHNDKDCSQCSRRSWYQKGYADAKKKIAEEYNNDFCEWRIGEYGDSWKPNCCDEIYYLRGVRKFKFCPYCGKKMKVVE